MGTQSRSKVQSAYIPQELLKEISKINNRLLIGVPRERSADERRLMLTPEAIEILTSSGHRVVVETEAGLGINYSDNHFSEAGAEIVQTPAEVFQADIILKILPPLPAEVALMKPRSTILSFVQLQRFAPEAFEGMMAKKINAIGYELMENDDKCSPLMTAIAEIEGTTSIVVAADLLSNTHGGKGVLLGGIPGVPPAEVVIIGADMAGTVAARAALALGACVKVFDDDIDKLRALQYALGQKVFTSNFHPNVLKNAFKSADVAIGAMNYYNKPRHYVISEDLIRAMKKGAVIIDLSMNQGGCFETTCMVATTGPAVFEQFGVLHYCKNDISNYVARTASIAFSNLFISLFLTMGDMGSLAAMIKADPCFRAGIYMYGGKPVNNYVSNHFNLLSNNLDIYLSAF